LYGLVKIGHGMQEFLRDHPALPIVIRVGTPAILLGLTPEQPSNEDYIRPVRGSEYVLPVVSVVLPDNQPALDTVGRPHFVPQTVRGVVKRVQERGEPNPLELGDSNLTADPYYLFVQPKQVSPAIGSAVP
jgi:hypothetical protein